jgi:hypothetical protein
VLDDPRVSAAEILLRAVHAIRGRAQRHPANAVRSPFLANLRSQDMKSVSGSATDSVRNRAMGEIPPGAAPETFRRERR